MSKHIENGLENGSGNRLWEMLDKETTQYA
jgi:hypothetical protein